MKAKTQDLTPSLILVDANAYLYRAYYVLASGEERFPPAQASLRSFARLVLRLLVSEAPEYLAIAFDTPGPALRHKGSLEYWAKRPKMPPDIRAILPAARRLLAALRLPVFEVNAYDADDVLATIAFQLRKENLSVTLVSGFKDALQLCDGVRVLNPHQRDRFYTRQEVLARFGVPPERIPDYLALVGDESQNIPGVPGIGPKRAQALLGAYRSVAGIYSHLSKLEEKVRANLVKARPAVEMGRKIATLDASVPLAVSLRDLAVRPIEAERAEGVFRDLGLLDILSEYLPHEHPTAPKYETIFTLEALDSWIEKLKGVSRFAVDTETTGLDLRQAGLVGISIAAEKGRAFYIPLGHKEPTLWPRISEQEVLAALSPILEDSRKIKVGQNLKFDAAVFARRGVDLSGAWFDTMIAAVLLDPARGGHTLDELALSCLGNKMIPFDELVPEGRTIADVPVERASEYACEDADVALRLSEFLEARLNAEGLKEIFENREIPFLKVLARMEQAGVRFDRGGLAAWEDELKREIAALEARVASRAGGPLDLHSSAQVGRFLFVNLGLTPRVKTPSGKPSTDEEALERMASDDPVVGEILAHRRAIRLRDGLVAPLEALCLQAGEVHFSYNPIGPIGDPILPGHPDLAHVAEQLAPGGRLRALLRASEGKVIVSVRFPAIEGSIFSELSGEETLKKDVLPGAWPWERRLVSAFWEGEAGRTLAEELGMEPAAVEQRRSDFWRRYPKLFEARQKLVIDARVQGRARTLFGRTRPLAQIRSSNPGLRAAAERDALRAVLWGSVVDWLKMFVVAAPQPLLIFKDEVFFEAAAADVPALKKRIQEAVGKAPRLNIPVTPQISVGEA